MQFLKQTVKLFKINNTCSCAKYLAVSSPLSKLFQMAGFVINSLHDDCVKVDIIIIESTRVSQENQNHINV